MNEALTELTIAEAAARIRQRQLSPVELTRALLERIERCNERYNAYLTVCSELALEAARVAEREIGRGEYRGVLHGIPLALKDIFAMRGVRMTCGSKILADYFPATDAQIVERLNAAGAVLLGKLNMHEFAWGGTSVNPHWGTPRNPWNLDCIPGGSSGGSAVAVAASLALGSIGTDTGGSVRIPAATSGVVGLKPTYGRVSRRGVYPLCWSMDHVGPLARTVTDAALLLQVIAGHDPADPTSRDLPVPDYTAASRGEVRGLRIGVPKEYFFDAIDPEVAETVRGALRHLGSLGAAVEEVSLPLMVHVPASSLALMAVEAYSVHERYMRTRPGDYGADVRARLLLGTYVLGPQYLKAQRVRALLYRQILDVLRRVDVLITPTTAITATPIDRETMTIDGKDIPVATLLSRFTRPFNMTGLPALSLPCGFTQAGLPVGMQIIGRPFGEPTVLRAGSAYEQSTPWHRRRPPDLVGPS